MFPPNISKLRAKRNIKKLIGALNYTHKKGRKDTVLEIRRGAAEALGAIGDARAVGPLSEALVHAINLNVHDRYYSVRFIEVAVEALGNLRDIQAIGSLTLALKFRVESVREVAARALGEIGDPRAVGPLTSASNDTNLGVKKAALWALAGIGDEQALKIVVKALGDDQKEIRKFATFALERRGWVPQNDIEEAYYLRASEKWDELAKLGAPAVEPLIHALAEEQAWRLDQGRTSSIIKLGNLATEALIDTLNDEDSHRAANAAYALGEIGDERAVEPLMQALDYTPDVQRAAARALRQLRPQLAATMFLELLGSEKLGHGAMLTAIETIGKTGDSRAVDILIQILRRERQSKLPSPDIRRAAIEALISIGDLKAVDAILESLLPEGKRRPDRGDYLMGVSTWGLESLMGDYAKFVIRIIDCIRGLKGWIVREDDLSKSRLVPFDTAIEDLCKIDIRISSNILHKIAKICDFGGLPLESQRKMAEKEIHRRGSPSYDPAFFLDKNAWKL